MKWFLAVAFCAAAWAADVPRIVYSKSFPKSNPAYIGISVDKTGAGEYREAVDDDNPVKFKLPESDVNEIFGLATKLEYFRKPLESPLKVAFMGTKTFRFESDPQKGEVKFNYSEDPAAQALNDWFEKIAESEQRYIDLERTAKYERLGVMDAILQLEISLDRKRLVDPQQFLPLLDRVAKNESYLHQARIRAAAVADTIRAMK